METKITSQTDAQVEFTVTLTETELNTAKKHVLDELRPRVKAAGFRPGKAPDMVVERELGSATIQSEVIEHAIQDTYMKAVREQNLNIVAAPEVSLEKFVPFTEMSYKVTVELMPKVKLPKYQDYKLKRPAAKVDPAEVDKTIADLQRREAVRLDVERPAMKNDEVNFDFDGTKGGEPVRGASAKGQTLLLGSNQFIPGFEEELIGLNVGDKKTFDIRFPKEYHEKTLADQVVQFAVKMNKITELIEPTLDDDFAVKVSPFKTFKELRADAERQLMDRAEEEVSKEYEQSVLDKLLKESHTTAPETLVRQQLDRLRAELDQNLAYSGLDYDKYVELSGKTSAQMENEMRPEAEKRVKLAMILTEVAATENISVDATELDAEIAKLKAQYPDEQTQAELDNPRTREEIYNHLMASRVIAKLLHYAESK